MLTITLARDLEVEQLIEFKGVIQRINKLTQFRNLQIIETTLPYSEWIYDEFALPMNYGTVIHTNV